ncbi:MAG: hypothetical protein M3015_01520, partial [Bacteroidota bacterium]|nr:hypothetical protein [Bacteroidota bacterium]
QGVDGLSLFAQPFIPLKGVLIDRCYGSIYYTNALLTGWQITRSVLNSMNGAYGNGAVFTNLLLENCYVSNINLNATSSSSTGVFNNNIFGGGTTNFNNGGYSFSNNIFLNTSAPASISNSLFDHNIGTNNWLPSANGNQTNVNLSTVFVGYPTQGTFSNDNRWMLATGSPAIGAGNGGIDAGMFGGTNAYRLSGIPAIPSFYQLTAPTNAPTSSPYTITFSVKSNN